ncbi:MAG: PIN domain nuclease, partial [Vagococcus sp.]|nr:PIN domain nuclease [Vagococcus sp.]
MQKKIFNTVMALIGFSLGATLIPVVWTVFKLDQNQWLNNDITNGSIGAIIFVIISIFTFLYVGSAIKKIKKFIGEQSLQ